MKAKGFVCSLFIVFLFVYSASAAAPTKNTGKDYSSYLGLRVGYGFSLVGENDYDHSSSYNLYGNQRVLFSFVGSFNLMSSKEDELCLALPFNLDVSYRFNDKWGMKRRHSEFLLDIAPQLGMNLGGITPFINAGPTFSLSYLKYEYELRRYDMFDHYLGTETYKEDYLSSLYGANIAAGGKVDLETIFAQLKLQYRFLWGTQRPLKDEIKEYLKNTSEKRQTIGLIGNVGLRLGGALYLEAGAKLEKSKDRFKCNYKDHVWMSGGKWSKWGKWSTGELRIFLGVGIMI